MIINPYIFHSYDADALLFINAVGITDVTQKSAINQLVVDLKAYSLWTKFSAIYPMVGGAASTHKWNLKDPRDLDAAYRLTFVGGWTHSSTGALPNGTTGYANTHFSPTAWASQFSCGISYYSRTNNLSAPQIAMGEIGANGSFCQFNATSANGILGTIAELMSYTASSSQGLFDVTRTANNDGKVYRNASQIASSTSTWAGAFDSADIFIGARNNHSNVGEFFCVLECAFACIHTGFNSTDESNFYTAVQAFQTTLSRQV